MPWMRVAPIFDSLQRLLESVIIRFVINVCNVNQLEAGLQQFRDSGCRGFANEGISDTVVKQPTIGVVINIELDLANTVVAKLLVERKMGVIQSIRVEVSRQKRGDGLQKIEKWLMRFEPIAVVTTDDLNFIQAKRIRSKGFSGIVVIIVVVLQVFNGIFFT